MYLNIKAYTKKSMIDFHKNVGGDINNRNKTKILFDELYYEKTKITFYNNLSVLFSGEIPKKLEKLINIIIDQKLYVGIDEVGVGESIGPLVVCGLKFKNFDSKKKVILNGIKDSKKMSWNEIKLISNIIKENSNYHIVALEPKKFNEVYKKVQNTKAINAIIQNTINNKMKIYKLTHITDQFVNEKIYKKYIKNSDNELFDGKLFFTTKAEEKYLEVAAAAILAKEYFNNWILNFFNERNINLKIEKKLKSWEIFKLVENNKLIIKDKENLIKDWTKKEI